MIVHLRNYSFGRITIPLPDLRLLPIIMKKLYISSLILSSVLFSAGLVLVGPIRIEANNSNLPPVVSIGVGNGNIPANTGPTHNAVFNETISVFATVLDTNLENYHFRVIKDGGSQGHNCTASNALFAIENQGYASTTLSKDVCGFNYNQSVYISPTGFTNVLIATLNTADLIAFGGDGDYWLILGALDASGSRAASNYLDDPKVKVTINSTTPVVPTPSTSSTGSSSSGGSSSGRSRGSSGQFTGEARLNYMAQNTIGGSPAFTSGGITIGAPGALNETAGTSGNEVSSTTSTTLDEDSNNFFAMAIEAIDSTNLGKLLIPLWILIAIYAIWKLATLKSYKFPTIKNPFS